MGLFLSTTINRIDSKGRVSIPGPFRSALASPSGNGIILMKSPLHPALEGFAPSTMDDIAARLDEFPLFSADQDDIASATMAEASLLNFDSEGRVVVPADLLAHAHVKNEIAFVGLGRKFQMWEPGAWNQRREAAQKAVRGKGLSLPRVHAGGGS